MSMASDGRRASKVLEASQTGRGWRHGNRHGSALRIGLLTPHNESGVSGPSRRSAVQTSGNCLQTWKETLERGPLTWCFGSPYGIRTRAATLRGWCPRPLDERAKLQRSTIPGELCEPARPVGWGARNRTLNNRTRICCVACYTTPHRSERRVYRPRQSPPREF